MEAEYGEYNDDVEKIIEFIKDEDLEGIKLILSKGTIDLNKIYPEVQTVDIVPCRCMAGYAIYYKKFESFTFLMESGTNVNLHHKSSLLGYTSQGNYINYVRYLLENEADPNLKDMEGKIPLFRSLLSNSITELRLLLEFGADPNIFSEGNHILHYISSEKNDIPYIFDKTKLLLEGGATHIDMKFLDEFSGEEREELEGLCYPRRKGAIKVLREEEE